VTDERLAWTTSRSKQLQVAFIGAVGVPLIHALGRTWRWRVRGLEHLQAIQDAGHAPVMAFWHGRILPSLYYFRQRQIVVITSDNFDGEWIARIIHRFGYSTVRGSTSRNAARAALKAKRRLSEGCSVGVTVDGPRGPALKVQAGAIWLAHASGNPVLPFHIEASPNWTLRSWDAAQIPRPFSRVALVLGEPLYVAAAADAAELERQRRRLEMILLSLRPAAMALLKE
jgi:lysophospholipid acyltransferase (LPLAT)-like uncharacterized protein